ncbi:TetR/AcrR family transcriptional regulator C-terminal domain-containing protein [Stenotrophomonas sp. Iso1]|uniref:TetR/AcrR family transcriptional regulator C-terminal domain-containing protein n=1 Tax=Stenotrophomonas sp. Iso1 TaxID=2977283 RepID=UPI0022B7C889|nr:TetR/AcrR family transcriptional regulator C-terminal domain-containing protein [Stenotrophomonas sp. Iso1]
MPRTPKPTTAATQRKPGKRAGLDLQQIVDAARLIDVDALSMQSLADRLRVDRKALNYHVKDKQTLLGLVAMDAFSARFSGTDVTKADSWEDACRIYGMGFFEGVLGVGGLAEYLWFGGSVAAWALEPSEALFQRLNDAGFADETAVRLVAMLISMSLSHARDATQSSAEGDRPRTRALKAALRDAEPVTYKNLSRIAELGVDTYGNAQMEVMLGMLIAGARTLLEKSTAPPRLR